MTLKEIQTRKQKIDSEIQTLLFDKKTLEANIALKRKQSKELGESIKNFAKKQEIVVTEHAIIQYLARVKGIDIEAIKQEIVPDNLTKLLDTLGNNGKFPNGPVQLVVKDRKIVTITV